MSKKPDLEKFEDMLAEFRAADVATATPSPSSITDGDERYQRVPATGWMISDDVIINACKRHDLAQLRKWGQQGFRMRTAEPLC
jgi:hypothetical protein